MKNVTNELIEEVVAQNFLDYSVSVIRGRALPDVRDGLKPIHRRLIYSLVELGLTPGKATKKCAHVVGTCLGKFHPHGDSSCYEALVRMGQDFVHTVPLVRIQGNAGSLNDPHSFASMRYTETALHKFAEEMIFDLPYECIPMMATYDGNGFEPEVLPTRIPYFLFAANVGIAVGFITQSLPYNVGEALQATIELIKDPSTSSEKLFGKNGIVKGPDFPTGGVITEMRGITEGFKTGHGLTKVRCRYEVTDDTIVITEIPYLVSKTSLIESIAEVRKPRTDGNGSKPPLIPEIMDLKDLSDKGGIKIKIRIKKGENPEVIANKLLKHTRMLESTKISYTAIVDGTPKEVGFVDAVHYWHLFRRQCLHKKHTFLADKARNRIHMLEGIIRVCANPEQAVKIIKDGKSRELIIQGLIKTFKIDKVQADYVLEMKVYRFSKEEILRSEKELENQLNELAFHELRIKKMSVIDKDIIEELQNAIKRYGVPRRTQICDVWETEGFTEDKFIEEEKITIYLSNSGYIKRVPPELMAQSQKRGGKGRKITAGKDDFIAKIISCSTHDDLFLVTTTGKAHVIKAYRIPEAPLDRPGVHAATLIQIGNDEQVTTILPIKEYSNDFQILTITHKGLIKRTPLSEYGSCKRQGGILTCKLNEGDWVVSCDIVRADKDANVIVTTEDGKVVNFGLEEVPVIKRVTYGVKSVARDKDIVFASVITSFEGHLLLVTTNGKGKRVLLEEFPVTHRKTCGVIGIKMKEKKDSLAGACIINNEEDEVVCVSSGKIIRFPVSEVSVLLRPAFGYRVMSLGETHKIESVSKVEAD